MKINLKASATVEAAFIVPLISFAVMCLIILIFFMYDRIKIESDLRFALEAAEKRYERTRQISVPETKAILEARIGKGLLMCDAGDIEVELAGTQVCVSAEINMRILGAEIPGLKPEWFSGKRMYRYRKICDREKTLRRIDIGLELWDRVVK